MKEKRRVRLSKTPMVLTGLVKVTGGYAIASATLNEMGEMVKFDIGPAQAFKQFVAKVHMREIARLGQAVG